MNEYKEMIEKFFNQNNMNVDISILFNDILAFSYISEDPNMPKECNNISVKLIIEKTRLDFRFMFINLNLDKFIKSNELTLNVINSLLKIGTYKYSRTKRIFYYTCVINLDLFAKGLGNEYIKAFEFIKFSFEEALKKIWKIYQEQSLGQIKTNPLPDNFCLDCYKVFNDCYCEENLIEEEIEIKNSSEIIEKIKSVKIFCDFFDFSGFFDDQTSTYVYCPTNTLLNRAKDSKISEIFLKKFDGFLDLTAKLHLYFKHFPRHIFMVSWKGDTIIDFSLALVFDRPYKYHRLFKSYFQGDYKQNMRTQLLKLLLEASFYNITKEDYIDIKELKGKEIRKKRVGFGGFSDIYENEINDKKVAIKIPKRGKPDTILKEFMLLKSIKGSYFSEVLGLLKYEKLDCLVMPLYSGGSLKELDKSTDLVKILEIMKKVATGLEHVHVHKVIHQDLKPINIMLETDDSPRIIDFGLAIKEDCKKLVCGYSPHFCDPDQVNNESPGIKADIWSFGMVLYSIIFKRLPFDFLEKNINENLIYKTIKKEGIRPEIPIKFGSEKPLLFNLLNDCWNSNPSLRPSALEIVERLSESILAEDS